ncbi:MAG: trpA [Phycisphaerales bacterium]|nr:trpA [Phycisphaerales bacterium]MDB5300450.1 trpA [Phycisphaerales bacterium]
MNMWGVKRKTWNVEGDKGAAMRAFVTFHVPRFTFIARVFIPRILPYHRGQYIWNETGTGMNPTRAARRTICQTFDALKARKQIGLVPFIPAGYPDLATTAAALPALESAGASAIEVGFPFSDPIADGPTIQESFTAALEKKLKIADIFATVRQARPGVSIPLVAMVSYSIVFRYGVAHFVAEAKSCGFDGLIVPDLPPPEAQGICDIIRSGGLDTILMVAPSTAPERRAEIARLSSGFVYYLSVSGITGERDQLPADLAENVRQLKGLTDRPICVGFGISQARHVAQLQGLADGAIVGSGVVKRMKSHVQGGPAAIAAALADYSRELLSQVRR